MSLSVLFHPAVVAWFERSFRAPTATQTQAWPAIKAGRNVLIAAPTGSGKTLAAFLTAIDDLIQQGLDGALPDETQVVYVSPLKALSNDIRKNLDAPLSDIHAALREQDLGEVDIRTWCGPAILPRESGSAWVAGHPTSSSRPRNLSMSCWDLTPVDACSRPPGQ
jgi:ATP-dependent Lhr-like helicase